MPDPYESYSAKYAPSWLTAIRLEQQQSVNAPLITYHSGHASVDISSGRIRPSGGFLVCACYAAESAPLVVLICTEWRWPKRRGASVSTDGSLLAGTRDLQRLNAGNLQHGEKDVSPIHVVNSFKFPVLLPKDSVSI